MFFDSSLTATVLLVDDEVDCLQLRSHVMERNGFSVMMAAHPVDALCLVAGTQEKIDVAVLDYHMPVMNGCQLAECLRAMRPNLKIILNSGALNIPQSEMADVDIFISKGDGVSRLLAQVVEFVQCALESSGARPGPCQLCMRLRNSES